VGERVPELARRREGMLRAIVNGLRAQMPVELVTLRAGEVRTVRD